MDQSGQRNFTVLHKVKFLHTMGGNLLFWMEKDEIPYGHFDPLTLNYECSLPALIV